MYPLVLGKVGTQAVFLPVMVAVPMLLLVKLVHSEGHSRTRALVMVLVVALGCLIGAKVFSLVVRPWSCDSLLCEIQGGWRYPGMLLGAVLIAPAAERMLLPALPLVRFGDLLGITFAFALAFGRIGCILAGCCTGAIGRGVLYLSYAPHSQVWFSQLQAGLVKDDGSWTEPVFALHLVFMVVSLLVGCILLWLDRRRRYDGQVLLAFLALHESTKAVLEWCRVPFIPAQFGVTIAAALIGVVGLAAVAARSAACSSPWWRGVSPGRLDGPRGSR